MNILDQMWIQYVYEPHLDDLVRYYISEIRATHDKERMDELIFKRPELTKVLKVIK